MTVTALCFWTWLLLSVGVGAVATPAGVGEQPCVRTAPVPGVMCQDQVPHKAENKGDGQLEGLKQGGKDGSMRGEMFDAMPSRARVQVRIYPQLQAKPRTSPPLCPTDLHEIVILATPQPGGRVRFPDLPPELLMQVLAGLSERDLARTAASCRALAVLVRTCFLGPLREARSLFRG